MSQMIVLLVPIFFSVSLAAESIEYAAIIYRHGDRIPVDPYPTDPWRNESLWPVKFGELTNIGKMQHFILGQWFRKRYSHLLSDDFDPSEIYIRSTDVDRTLMSAEANLAGMYPPSQKSKWNQKLMWQPIPVHTVPEKTDEVLAMSKKCIAYDKEMERVVNSAAYIKRLSKYQDLMDYLTANTGRKIKTYHDIESIYSNLNIETLYNFTLPNWTQAVYPDKMREPSGYSFATSAATPLLARLKAGPLVKEIVSNMENFLSGKIKRKLSIYSGHDFTIGTLLNGLGVFDGNCPVYTATILMELIYDNSVDSHFIRISYRNSTEIVEPYILPIPYCGKRCPGKRFIKLYDNLLTVDFDAECGKQFPIVLGMSFFIGLVIFASIYVAHKVHFGSVARQNGFYSYATVHTGSVSTIKVISV